MRRPPVPRHYETVLDEADARALADGDRARASSCASTPRRRASIRCRRRSSGCRSRSSRGTRATSRSRIAIPARPTSCRSTRRSRASRRGSPIASRRKLGQNVKYDQHVLANHGLALAGVAHDTLLQSYVLEAHRPHDMDNLAWRHLTSRRSRYAEVAGKGAKQIGFDQVSIDDATAYSAEDADITLQLHRLPVSARRGRSEARPRLHDDRDAGARSAVPRWSATA